MKLSKTLGTDSDNTSKPSADCPRLASKGLAQKEIDRSATEASAKIRKTQKNVFRKLAK